METLEAVDSKRTTEELWKQLIAEGQALRLEFDKKTRSMRTLTAEDLRRVSR